MKNVLGMVLAGGEGSRLRPLTHGRSKPAVPFGGSYRLIDFALNNFTNSDIMKIYVLTQFKSQSLYQHLKRGWNVSGFSNHFIDIIPAQMRDGKRWYEGTADAIYQNLRFIEMENPEQVCIFGSDHIYKIDVEQMLDFHTEKNAKMTVSAVRMPLKEASQFGVIEVDQNGRMIGFEEKPEAPKCIPGIPDMALVSMGNYVFETEALFAELREDAKNQYSSHDFGNDIIPKMFPRGEVYVYDFSTNVIKGENPEPYWRDVGTIDSYWEAHMDMLKDDAPFSLYNENWKLHTHMTPLPPAFISYSNAFQSESTIRNLISNGSVIKNSTVTNSVIGLRSHIDEDCVIVNCVLLGDVTIGKGCVLRNVIIDKNCVISPNTQIGVDKEADERRFAVSDKGIVVVAKGDKV